MEPATHQLFTLATLLACGALALAGMLLTSVVRRLVNSVYDLKRQVAELRVDAAETATDKEFEPFEDP